MLTYIKNITSNLIKSLFLLMIMVLFTINLSAQQAANYEEAIKVADQLYKEKSYIDAKSYYQLAIRYKQGDEYASTQISAIVETLKSQVVDDDEYFDIIDLADVLWEEKAYEKALDQYLKALEIIPDDKYARDRVNEIRKIQTEEKDRINAFALAMSDGNTLLAENKYDEAIVKFEDAQMLFPERSAPAENIELARQLKTENASKLEVFNQQMEESGRYLLIKNYVIALEGYEKARALFPDNAEVNAKIEEISPLAENQKKYNKQVETADELYISKDYMAAKAAYLKAEKAWPENSYPRDMIGRIDEQLAEQMKNLDQNYRKAIASADSLLAMNEYDGSKAGYNLALTLKPNESYPKSKLKEIESHFAEQQKMFEANYSTMVAKADSLLDARQLDEAESQYMFALSVKPDDEYPKQKLEEIGVLRVEIAEQEKLNASYQDVIAEADKLYSNGHYDLALKKYAEAQQIKSIESYPEERILAIRQLLMDVEKQREIDEKFASLIMLAGRLKQEDKLSEARSSYENAAELKPLDPLPQNEIKAIDSTISARVLAAEAELIYKANIRAGDSLMKNLEYDAAILAYEAAIAVKADTKEASEKLLTARTTKRNYERALARDAKYNDAIKKGDEFFAQESYELAQPEYELALETKPEEAYPRQQLSEITVLLKRLEAEKEQRYKDAIVKGDNSFQQGDYRDAVLHFKTANSIKPLEAYPKQKMEECNTILAEELRRAKEQYDLAIADADKFYASKIYDKAIRAYQDAGKLKPDETYPAEMIVKITSYIEENAIVDVMKEVMEIDAGVTKRFEFEPVRINVRKSNYVLIKARNRSGNDFKIIFTYGSNKGKNGGFVVQVPQNEEYNDFIIRVGNQYKWFSEDNDWISVYPENGDIEIKMIRISASE